MTINSLVVALIYLCLPWCLIEATSQVLHHLSSRQGSALLSLRSSSKETKRTWISRGPLWFKIETTSLNNVPGHLLRRVNRLWESTAEREVRPSRGSNGRRDYEEDVKSPLCQRAQRLLELFYDAGTIFAGAALLGSIIFLIWGAFDLIGQISQLGGPKEISSYTVQKREVQGANNGLPKERGWSLSLVPLIPGLTLPVNHVYPLLLALSLTQIIHEAGHAICGTLQSWIPLRMGLIVLFPCIPGAFVVLPHEAIEEEGDDDEEEESFVADRGQGTLTRKRLRNISAGVWHNAVTAMLLALVIYTGVGRALHGVLWKDANGMRVECVDASSPLLQHMPVDTLITRLDDFDLTDTAQIHRSPVERQMSWDQYLLQGQSNPRQDSQGWCVPRSTWDSQPTTCCDALSRNSSDTSPDAAQDLLCFHPSFNDLPTSPGRCYDPIRLVSGKVDIRRCSSKCSEDEICIEADIREQLIRIKVTRSGQESSRVVLFQGSPVTVYSALTVSPYKFRFDWIGLPYHVFQWWNLLLSYLLDLSLAMALLNMLPLPSLDGDVYLAFVLAAIISRYHIADASTEKEDYEDEEGAISGIQLDDVSTVTSRPYSPTQLRRPSAPYRSAASAPYRQQLITRKVQHTSNARVQAKIQERFRWFTVCLAVFVFGGSILLHAIKQS